MNSGPPSWYKASMDYRAPLFEAPLVIAATSVTALDRRTGAQRWTHELKAPARKLAILDDRIFVLDGDATVSCIDVQSGVLIGKLDLDLAAPNALLWDGEMLYVSGDYEVIALDRNGSVLWKQSVPSNGSHTRSGMAVPGVVVLQPDFADGR